MKTHHIVKDTAGAAGYERHACITCDSTCLRQPWMSDILWEAKLRTWQLAHPAVTKKEKIK